MDFMDFVRQVWLHLTDPGARPVGRHARSVALHRSLCCRLLRDGPGGDADPARRQHALRGRRGDGDNESQPARHPRSADRRRRFSATRSTTRSAITSGRPPSARNGRGCSSQAPAARPAVLRQVRRQGDHPGPLRADRPHLRPLRGRHRQDEIPQVLRLQRRRRRGLGADLRPGRPSLRRNRAGQEELRAGHGGHRPDFGDADGRRVHPGPASPRRGEAVQPSPSEPPEIISAITATPPRS